MLLTLIHQRRWQRQLKTIINTASQYPTINYRQTRKSINDEKSQRLSATILKSSDDEVKQEDNQPSTKESTSNVQRQSQVNATIYLLLVDSNAQCQQTWPTSTIGYQHTATIRNQKHNTPQSKTANKCRKETKRGGQNGGRTSIPSHSSDATG